VLASDVAEMSISKSLINGGLTVPLVSSADLVGGHESRRWLMRPR
jgi:hypothetical protein